MNSSFSRDFSIVAKDASVSSEFQNFFRKIRASIFIISLHNEHVLDVYLRMLSHAYNYFTGEAWRRLIYIAQEKKNGERRQFTLSLIIYRALGMRITSPVRNATLIVRAVDVDHSLRERPISRIDRTAIRRFGGNQTHERPRRPVSVVKLVKYARTVPFGSASFFPCPAT